MTSHEYLKIRRCTRRISKSECSRNSTTESCIARRLRDSINLNILKDNHKYTMLYGVA